MMDTNDKYAEFIVLTSCGNPLFTDTPIFECKELKKNKIDDDTYEFWTEVAIKNATVKNLRYEFSDGTVVNKTNPSEKFSHDFTPGKHTVKVTVTYIVNGVEQSETLQTKCQTEIEVPEKKVPSFACELIQPITIGELKYQFKGKASYKDTEIVSASFDFGDGKTGEGVISNKTATGADIASEIHQYADFTGKKTITLSVEFKNGNDKHNAKCKTEISREVLGKCIPKPGEDQNCQELPKTGPTEIFGAAAGISGLGAAGMYYRASRKNLSSLLDKFKR